MHAAGTEAASKPDLLDAQLRANLAALRNILPGSAKILDAAESPHTLEATLGRDGATTFSWHDNAACRRQWLGSTTMPSISEAALDDQFDPGDGNVVFAGIAHGTTVRLLARRLRPHQAIFVVEPEPWRARAALQLHDFCDLIASRRLLLFAGRDAWDEIARYLAENAGYLIPDRTPAWPWLSRTDVHALTQQVAALQARVNEQRSESSRQSDSPAPTNNIRVFIASNGSDARTHRWARRLADAAQAADAAALCCVPDDPATMHPAHIEKQIDRLHPNLTLLIDCAPGQIAYRAPDTTTCLVITHTRPLQPEFLSALTADQVLFVRTHEQRQAILDRGHPDERIALLQPGVSPATPKNEEAVSASLRFVILADFRDADPATTGLHLASHQRLWQAAREWIERNIDTYDDAQASAALAQAEKSLDLQLRSDDVRAGLTERIRNTLGPHLVVEHVLSTLADAGIPFELHGKGWERHERFADYAADSTRPADNNNAVLLWLETQSDADDRLLAWLASDRPAYIRTTQSVNLEADWRKLLDESSHVVSFASTDELQSNINRFANNSASLRSMAAAAGEHLRQIHSWQARWNAIQELCGTRNNTHGSNP